MWAVQDLSDARHDTRYKTYVKTYFEILEFISTHCQVSFVTKTPVVNYRIRLNSSTSGNVWSISVNGVRRVTRVGLAIVYYLRNFLMRPREMLT